MKKPTVIITGCGFKPVEHVYTYEGQPTHNVIDIDGIEHKMNVGTAVAFYLVNKGVEIIMVSRTLESLEKIKNGLIKLGCSVELISFIASDITTDDGVKNLIEQLPKEKTFYWVQSIGMGGGAYKVPNDNIYLPFEQISPDLIANEMNIVTATHRMMLKMVQIFRNQIKNGDKAKISVITSMSGERGYHFGATHVAAKHALVGYIKGIEKELEDEGIEIYDIRPGAIDTGMYDNPHVKEAVEELSRRGNMYLDNGNNPVYAPPIKVGEAVYDSLFGENPKKVYRILAPYQS
jgi:short-subunit dehydrogenase